MRYLFSLLPYILFSPLFSQISGTTFAEASATKTGKIVFVYNEVSGFTEKKSDGAEGFLVDLMIEFERYVLKEKGINLTHEFHYTGNDFPQFMNQVRISSGGVFGLGNVSIKEERKKDFSFSPPFLGNISLLVTNGNVPLLESVQEIPTKLAGMKAYSIRATTNEERVKRIKEQYLPSLEIEYFSSTNIIIDQLLKDDSAFAIIDLNFYLEALKKRLAIKRHPVADEQDVPFGIIMPKNSDWTPILESFFSSGFIESPRYGEIVSKNLGSGALRLLDRMKRG